MVASLVHGRYTRSGSARAGPRALRGCRRAAWDQAPADRPRRGSGSGRSARPGGDRSSATPRPVRPALLEEADQLLEDAFVVLRDRVRDDVERGVALAARDERGETGADRVPGADLCDGGGRRGPSPPARIACGASGTPRSSTPRSFPRCAATGGSCRGDRSGAPARRSRRDAAPPSSGRPGWTSVTPASPARPRRTSGRGLRDHRQRLHLALASDARSQSRFIRAITWSWMPVGQRGALADGRAVAEPPRAPAPPSRARGDALGWPWGRTPRWVILARVKSAAEAFGHAATHAPHPMHAAASMASVGDVFGTRIAFASGALP